MLASKSNDHEGFYLLQTMIECMPAEALNQYIKGIFQLLFSRLTSSKTTKFVKSFLVFIFLYTCHHGGQSVQELIDSIQPNMFGMVIDRLVILEVQKVCLFIYFLFVWSGVQALPNMFDLIQPNMFVMSINFEIKRGTKIITLSYFLILETVDLIYLLCILTLAK